MAEIVKCPQCPQCGHEFNSNDTFFVQNVEFQQNFIVEYVSFDVN